MTIFLIPSILLNRRSVIICSSIQVRNLWTKIFSSSGPMACRQIIVRSLMCVAAIDLRFRHWTCSLWSNNFQFKYINDKSRIRYKAGVQATITDNSNDYDTGILPLIPDYLESVTGLILCSSIRSVNLCWKQAPDMIYSYSRPGPSPLRCPGK